MPGGMSQAILLISFATLLRLGFCGGRFETPFRCHGLSISDQTRQGALSLINGIRSSVALGDFKAQNFLPSASDMEKLSWDCNLEAIAEGIVQGCSQDKPPVFVPNAVNYYFFGQGTPSYVLRNPLESAVLQWTEVSHVVWPSNSRFFNPVLRDFANLIHATTNSVGCSETKCGNQAAAACVFSKPNLEVGEQVYTPGYPCQHDSDCHSFTPAYCESGLCVNAVRPLTTIRPTTRTTTMTTTTTTTRKKSTDCPSTAFSSAFRETALGAHNNFRSQVTRGLVRNAEHPGEYAPPSSRMDLLIYDCTAEQYALNHVRLCDRQISPATSRPGYEENIHILETTQTDHLGALQNAIMTWNNELTNNGIPSNMIFTLALLQRQQRTVNRVTKVLWGANRHVGCASHVCPGFYFVSCMYRVPVNVVGQSIYTIGPVCGACLAGPNNCNKAIGLCSW